MRPCCSSRLPRPLRKPDVRPAGGVEPSPVYEVLSSLGVSRRTLFRGRGMSLRPPWALAEDRFVAACTRCGDCLRACPESILTKGSGGFPTVDFKRGACTFCGGCVEACDAGALLRNQESKSPNPWRHRVEIGPECLADRGVECRVCGEVCDPRAIRFQPRLRAPPQPLLDPEVCTGCGACIGACPTDAVTVLNCGEDESG